MALSNGSGRHMLLQPLSETSFILPDVKRIRTICEFLLENGSVQNLFSLRRKNMNGKKLNNIQTIN